MFSRYYYLLLLGLLFPFYTKAQFSPENYKLKFQPMLPASSHQVQADFEKLSNGDAVFIDLNGDGYKDFIETGISTFFADGSSSIRSFKTLVYFNDGNNNYIEDTNSNIAGFAWGKLLPADLDNDGDIDIIISGYNDNFEIKAPLYLNDGNGNFTLDQHLPLESNIYDFLDYTDIDNDNDIDIIVSSPPFGGTATVLLLQDSTGTFSINEEVELVQIEEGVSKFFDVNEDGNQDIIILGKNPTDETTGNIYINNGSGMFTIDSTSNIEGFYDAGITSGDFDNDGDTDLVVTGMDSMNEKVTKIFFNEGNGEFLVDSTKNFFGVRSGQIKTLDAENDGDLDLFFVKNEEGFLYLNDGTGLFTESNLTNFASFKDPFIETSDVNGDGYEDIFISGGSLYDYYNILYINDGTGRFTENLITPFQDLSRGDAAIADVDNDGDYDVLIAGEGQDRDEYTQLYLNDGTGEFEADSLNDFLGMRVKGEMKFKDLDNDGDEDLVLTGGYTPYPDWNLQNKIYLNDGNGLFTDHITLTGYVRSSIDFADVENDGDLDILITGDRSSAYPVAKLYINDGTANFTENTDVPFIGVEQGTGTFGDVDGDNDMDVIITGNPEPGAFQNTLYINDGAGNFTLNEDNSLLGIFESTTDFVDVDNDGDMDLFQTGLTVGGSGWTPHALLYINDGAGLFTEAANTPFVPVGGASVEIVDIDSDGDKDITITGQEDFYLTRKTWIYLNDGSGNFTENTPYDFIGTVDGRVLFEDLDNDEDKDLFIYGNINTGYDGITRLYRNESCFATTLDTTITSCDTLFFNDNILTSSGVYEFTLVNHIGCDSVITVDLTILESTDTLITTTECDNYTLNGTVYEETGVYSQLLTNTVGCDSTITLDLTILNSSFKTIEREACDSLEINGELFTSSGIYQQILTNSIGCDSTLTINLNILESTSEVINIQECESYIANGELFTTSGTYIQNLTNLAGCDSTLTINLSILELTEEIINEESCGSLELNGQLFSTSGTYTQHLINVAGCDSLLTLNLTILKPTEEILEVETCDSYDLNGEILTQSCVFTQVLTNSVGCDSTITLNLTILESTYETIYRESCDSFTTNGETYTSSGVYVQNLTNSVGCDSTLTINLEIGQTTYDDLIIEACESYEFNGIVYNESGFHEIITNNSTGCEHITYLNLTILEPTSETIVETGCDNITINGEAYFQAGVYEQHLTNIAGCDSTLTIDLLLMHSSESVIYAESCDSYEINGEVYNTSGIYVQNLTNNVGCDSTLTLNLEINTIDTEVILNDRTFTVNEIDADRYQWTDCLTNEPIPGANERSYKTRVSGEFAVEVIKNGCIVTSACQQIIVTSLAENEFSNSIKFYPNPAKEKVNLVFLKSYNFIEITSFSISGKEIETKKFTNTNQLEFPIEKAPSGLILLNIITSEGSHGIIKIQKD